MISIEHAANAVVGAFWLVLATSEKLRIQKRVIVLYLPYCQRTKLYSVQNLNLGFILKISQFQPRYSYNKKHILVTKKSVF